MLVNDSAKKCKAQYYIYNNNQCLSMVVQSNDKHKLIYI